MDTPISTPPIEIWQVDVGGQIYEANFDELKQWIAEGSLLPQDKVRRGNLRWIEAQKVPLLYNFFNAADLGVAPPTVTTTTAQSTIQANSFPSPTIGQTQNVSTPPQTQQNPNLIEIANTRFCLVHIETKPKFICDGCANVFCEECPQSFGGTVKVCPMCGGMCKPIGEVVEKEQKIVAIQQAGQEGFGFSDFGRALAYPLKFKVSLFFGAVFYMFFTIGQHASSLGGRWLISASIICWMLANMLTFGILANTVENMLQGKINQNFMPSFDDFTLWDDVIHPLFLSSSTILVSFGGFAILCLVVVYFVVSSVTSDVDSVRQKNMVPMFAPELQSNYGPATQGKEQIDLVKDTLKQRDEYIQQKAETAEEQFNGETVVVNSQLQNPSQPQVFDEEQYFQQMNEMVNKNRQQQLESTIGKQSDGNELAYGNLYKMISTWGSTFAVLAVILFLWGIFYFPVALIVASYTRNLASVMNPLVGLDTIKRLGFDYVKILFFGFLLLIIGGVIGLFLNMVFAPFDLPRLGNLPSVAVGSMVTFYLSIVFSTLIGFALYKNLDSFKLYRN